MIKFKNQLSSLLVVLLITAFISTGTLAASAQVPHHSHTRLRSSVVLYLGNPKAYVNNKETNVDTTNKEIYPVIRDGRTLVPIRFIAEGTGANVGWDAATATAIIKYEGKEIKLTLGSNKMMVNGQVVILDTTATFIDGRVFIPLRALVEALGKEVFYYKGLIIISETPKIFDVVEDRVSINDLINLFETNNSILEKKAEQAWFHAIIDEKDRALLLANEIIKSEPTSPIGYYAMGEVLSAIGQYEEALKWYKKAIEVDSEYIPAHYELAMLLYGLDLYDEALKVYDQIIKLTPKYVSAYRWRATILEEQLRYNEAIEDYNKAIEVDYNLEEIHYYKAIALARAERYQEALGSFDEAIAIDSSFDMAYFEKALVLATLERYEEAIQNLQKATDIDPDYIVAHYYKAEFLIIIGQYNEAIKILDSLIRAYPGFEFFQELKDEALTKMNN